LELITDYEIELLDGLRNVVSEIFRRTFEAPRMITLTNKIYY